jgi:hypothetical protein
MFQPTKYCELTVYLNCGTRVTGRFHVHADTSRVVRPLDAIRDIKGGFLPLTDVDIKENEETRHRQAIMISCQSIAHIELPEANWTIAAKGEPVEADEALKGV